MGDTNLELTEPIATTSGNTESVVATSETKTVTPVTPIVKGTEPVTGQSPATSEPAKDELTGYLEDPSLKDRALGFQRLVTKRTQELAEQKKVFEASQHKISAYDQFINSGEFERYKVWADAQQNQPQITREEVESAISDPVKMQELISKNVDIKVQKILGEVNNLKAQSEYQRTLAEKETEINDVASTFPDFWELYDTGLLTPIIKQVVDSGKGTLIDAVNQARAIKESFEQKALEKANSGVMTKKGATSLPPTSVGEPSVIYAKNRNDAFRLAFENAVLGKRVNVRTQQK